MRSLALGFAFIVCSVSTSALAAPRQIRISLDDVPTSSRPVKAPSHGVFLGEQAAPSRPGRLIRLSLDGSGAIYGHLRRIAVPGRRIRTTLD